MSFDSISSQKTSNQLLVSGLFPRRALTIDEQPVSDDCHIYTLAVYLNAFNPESNDQCIQIDLHKRSTTQELIEKILEQTKGKTYFCFRMN